MLLLDNWPTSLLYLEIIPYTANIERPVGELGSCIGRFSLFLSPSGPSRIFIYTTCVGPYVFGNVSS